jgi:hypothetical protein
MKAAPGLSGRWRIDWMEEWDRDWLDMNGPAHLLFAEGDGGELQFGTVYGELDCRHSERDGQLLVEFSWSGNEELEEACGRGWAVMERPNRLSGRIFIHAGCESAFTAARSRASAKKKTQRR